MTDLSEELLFLKKPMLLIPLPKGISRGDQVDNAKYFEANHFATVIEQKDLTEKRLIDAIDKLFDNEKKIAETLASSNQKYFLGAQNICDVILSVAKNSRNKN